MKVISAKTVLTTNVPYQ